MENIEFTKFRANEIHIKGNDLMIEWRGKKIVVYSKVDYPKR